MKDKGYAVFGFAIIGIAVLYTVYTVFVIYDIKIDTQTIIYYLMAVCFVTSVVYRYKEKKRKYELLRSSSITSDIEEAEQSPTDTEARVEIDKDKNPYPDSLFN